MSGLRLRVPRLWPYSDAPEPPPLSGHTPAWRTYDLHGDARRVYVSSSEGNDSNDGLSDSTPKATIAAGKALIRDTYGDHLLLKKGDTWDEGFGTWAINGFDVSYPTLISSYGTGARPLLRPTGGLIYIQSYNYTAIVGIHGLGRYHDQTLTDPVGIRALPNAPGGWNHLTIEDCRMEQFFSNYECQGYPGDPAARASNFVMRGCLALDAHAVDGAHSQGAYVYGIDGLLIEDSVFDHNGRFAGNPYATGPTVFRHNLYLQEGCTDAIVRRCYCTRSTATGLSIRSSAHSIDNILYLNSVAMTSAELGVVERNIFIDSKDIDGSNPRGWGIVMDYSDSGSVCGDNLIVQTRDGGGSRYPIQQSSTSAGVTYRRNRVWNFGGPCAMAGSGTLTLEDNHFQEVGSNTNQLLTHGTSSISASGGNKFYRAAGDANWLTRGGTPQTVATWKSNVSDTTSEAEQVSYPDTTRDFGTYNQTVLGGDNDPLDFIAALRAQSKDTWDTRLSQPAVAAWISAGWGMSLGTPPPPGEYVGPGYSVTIRPEEITLCLTE